MIRAAELDRRITLQRPVAGARDGFGHPAQSWADVATVWAKKTDASDAERLRAMEVGATLTCRFLIRWSCQLAACDPTWRIVFKGRVYNVEAVREPVNFPRRSALEISGTRRAEAAA